MSEIDASTNGKPIPENVRVPEILPLMTLSDQVVFPMSLVPLRVTSAPEIKLVGDTVMSHRFLALLTLRAGVGEARELADFHAIGCIGRIMQLQRVGENHVNALIQALKRFRPVEIVQREPYLVVRTQIAEEPPVNPDEIAPLIKTLKNQMARFIELSPNIPESAAAIVQDIDDAGFLSDLVSGSLSIAIEEKQKLLSTLDRKERLDTLVHVVGREVELMEVSNKIQRDVKTSIDKSQREFFLRQQLKAIHDELGEGETARPRSPSTARRSRAWACPTRSSVKPRASSSVSPR